jgi:hypothetical protein
MDAERFDRVVQTLAADGVSRRRVLKGLLGVAAGGALARVGSRPADAGNGCQTHEDCPNKQLCNFGTCRSRRNLCRGGLTACVTGPAKVCCCTVCGSGCTC